MRPSPRALRAAICAALVILPSFAQPQHTPRNPAAAATVLSPEEARNTAGRLLRQGHARAAQDILLVLIERDATDATSHTLLAHAFRMQGQNGKAVRAGRAAWAASERDIEKYGAALASAQALSKNGQRMRAQWWLRRAAHVAPDDQLRARAIRDFSYVRQRTPLSVNLRFGITPSDNVNNAPRDNRLILGGLVFVDETAIPLSGVETRVGGDVRYRFNIQQTRRDYVGLSFDHNRVDITDGDRPEGVDESDFNYTNVTARIGREWQLGPDRPLHNLSFSTGRIWSGGAHLSNEVRLHYTQKRRLTPRNLLTWYVSAGHADRQDKDIRSGVTSNIGLQWSTLLNDGARLSLNAGLSRTDTRSRTLTHTGLTYGATYTLGQPVMGAIASLSLAGKLREDDDAAYGPDPRRDDGYVFSTSLFFKDFDTHGFAPKVSLNLRRTKSNVARFETRNIGISIGFQSAF